MSNSPYDHSLLLLLVSIPSKTKTKRNFVFNKYSYNNQFTLEKYVNQNKSSVLLYSNAMISLIGCRCCCCCCYR